MDKIKVKVLPEVFELLLEFIKSQEKEIKTKEIKTEEIQQITFYK